VHTLPSAKMPTTVPASTGVILMRRLWRDKLFIANTISNYSKFQTIPNYLEFGFYLALA
jgi:hypothetical protein